MSTLLVINAGSSSVKFAGFAAGTNEPRTLFRGQIEPLSDAPRLLVRDAAGVSLEDRAWPAGTALSHAQSFDVLRAWLEAHGAGDLVAVGHRVVHGGTRFAAPVRCVDAVLRELDALVPLAPLHQPHNLAIIRAVAARSPQLPQVACFDTAFHRTLPEVAQRFALPRTLHDQGIRRYGFHGLSYEFVARRLREIDPVLAAGRVIVAHLGAGSSLCALHAGRSVDTTMSFTPLDGVPMATRCGALDAGVLLHLLAERQCTVEQLTHLLYYESGLLGISGISGDTRALLASDAPAAREAVEVFVYRVVREIGALVAVLGGLDALVFTGGIGEHQAAIRQAVCARAHFAGLELEAQANALNALQVSAGHSAAPVFVVPTDEEAMIAIHTRAVLDTSRSPT